MAPASPAVRPPSTPLLRPSPSSFHPNQQAQGNRRSLAPTRFIRGRIRPCAEGVHTTLFARPKGGPNFRSRPSAPWPLRRRSSCLALIWIASPVAGLRPTRAGRFFAHGPGCSIFIPQQERGRAAVGFGDDPQSIFAKVFARFPRVNRVGRENPETLLQRFVVAGRILRTDDAPISAREAKNIRANVPVNTLPKRWAC